MLYEYVTKKEYNPIREELEEIIRKTHQYMRKNHNLTFQHRLIGSGSRHLITRQISGNKGFDFDYNFIIKEPSQKSSKVAKSIKNKFSEALKSALQDTRYSSPQDSTSAITIKMIDKQNSKIKHSCDFAIIYCSNNSPFDMYYLRNNKTEAKYSFEPRQYSSNIDNKIKQINSWESIKKEYLKLKNANKDQNKHSFDLYTEAINNVYNQKFKANKSKQHI